MDHDAVIHPIKPSTKEETYLRDQKQKIEGIRVGEICPAGCKITKIFARGDEYVIYEIESNNPIESIRVYIHTKIEENETPIQNFNKAKDSFDRIKSILFKYSADTSYKQRAASALVVAIRGSTEEANTIFEKIETDAKADFTQRVLGLLYYLIGALILCTVLCATALISYINRDEKFFTENIAILNFCYAASYAAIGGLFSVSLKAKDIWAQQAIDHWMYGVYGAERLIISAIAGIITYTAIKSGIIFSFAETTKTAPYMTLSICFLSGFSESLIPNYMGRLEKEA